uniref:Cytochrome P450 85A1 n=1 Tax=Picea sitchensis TaxID=3332 RepID=A9P221_PICSI|nr:unknown [Picea sitchensis]
MGWPLFGETSDFLKSGQKFIKIRRARYGELFRSHILGCPTVISTDPALNRYILLNEGRGLIPGYPQSMLDILGKWNIAAVQNSLHKTMRGAMLALINPSMIKDHLLSDINNFMDIHFQHWNDRVINLQDKTKEMALLLSLKQVMSMNSGPKAEAFMLEFYKLVEGTISMPINLPGTSYRRGFQARENVLRMLREVLRERRASTDTHNDMIAMLLNDKEEEDGASVNSKLTDEQILDLLISIINAGYETVSTTTMMAVKYLHDNPEALRQLREEHLAIKRRKNPGETVNWDDYKSMKFTRSVIYETLRIATIVNGVLRKTTQDMEMKGFLIPKGWRIYVYMAETNQDNFLYPDFSTFNPWRWQEKNGDSLLYFMAFGGGSRLCPGKELGLVEISMFLHYFVTRYRWEEVGGDEILSFPRVVAPKGLRIKVSEY